MDEMWNFFRLLTYPIFLVLFIFIFAHPWEEKFDETRQILDIGRDHYQASDNNDPCWQECSV
jgi:hypothetical protein